MHLPGSLRDLPEHCLGSRRRRTNQYYRALRSSNPRLTVRLPPLVEGFVDGVIHELDEVVFVMGMFHEKPSCPKIFHFKTDECTWCRHTCLLFPYLRHRPRCR